MTRILKSTSSNEPTGWKSMDADQPHECFKCGRIIRISRETCGFKTMVPKLSFHFVCPEPA